MGKAGERTGNLRSLAQSTLIGGGIFLAVSLSVLLLFAAMISAGLLGQSNSIRPALMACVVGGLAGGWFTCIHWPSRKFLAGLSASLVGFFLLFLLRLTVFGSLHIKPHALSILAASLCGGMLAGLMTAGKKNKKKRRSY